MRCLALLAALAPLAGAQTTIQVPADQPTIQAGLDAAAPGDTVLVAPGVYHEHVQLREKVTLEGSGWRKTILDGGGVGDVVTSDGIQRFTLARLTVRGSHPDGAGVLVVGDPEDTFAVNARIEQSRIVDNGDGVRVVDVHAGTLAIERNTIDRNAGHGIDVFIGTTTIQRNTIVHNGGAAILTTDGSGLVVANSNAICFNGGEALLRAVSTPTLIHYNAVWANGGGYVELVGGEPQPFAPWPGTNELAVEPGFTSHENGDYFPAPDSPLVDAGDPNLGFDHDGTEPEIGAQLFVPGYKPTSASYGAGCGPTAGWFWEPIVGQPYYESHVDQAPPSASALVLVGVSDASWQGLPLPLELGALGAPGCWLLTGPILTFPAVTDAAGSGWTYLPIPDDPLLVGAPLHHQWMVASPGANPLGFVFSDGVASKIRP